MRTTQRARTDVGRTIATRANASEALDLRGLKELPEAEYVAQVRRGLSGDRSERLQAVLALGIRTGDWAYVPLARVIRRDASADVRMCAVKAMGFIRRGERLLASILSSSSYSTRLRAAAADALSISESPPVRSVAHALLVGLESRSPVVRYSSLHACATRRFAAARPRIVRLTGDAAVVPQGSISAKARWALKYVSTRLP